MPRPSRLILQTLGACLCAWVVRPAVAADDYTFHHENVMGTSLELCVRADHAEDAVRAESAVLAEIDRLSTVFSGYDPSSEFRRWQAAPKAPLPISPELLEVLGASDRWRSLSGGAFDARVEILSRLWSDSARRNRPPTAAELDSAKALLTPPAWRLDPESRTAERLSDCPLTLNAIAKGYIVGKACDAALAGGRARGVRGILLNVGGDMRVVGETPRTVGIVPPWADSESAEPMMTVEVKDRAVATSGRSQRGFRVNGRWYSHIIDPRTGRPADHISSATVIALNSTDADALATVLNVLTPDDGLRLAKGIAGVECLIVASDGSIHRSDGWRHYERPLPKTLAFADPQRPKGGETTNADKTATPSGSNWGDENELVVNFEINRPADAGGRYRRPYVAIWVEDKNGFPVRNVILWVSQGGSGPFGWLPDMSRWYRSDRERKKVDKTEMVFTIARPTRPPGKYSVVWDGKDDKGKPLPKGEYTVFIDAAREHGTYQNISKKVIIADKPFAEELKGNVEIKSASIEYRHRTGPDAGARGR
jgi:thiamine biosynthesis lipoprotein ApbE